MDKELREFSKCLYDWLYAEFYDEHRTCKPPPSPPPPEEIGMYKHYNGGALIKSIKSENIITDVSNMFFAEYIMYVKEGEEFISFEFIKTEITGDSKQSFVLVCYKGDENDITELSTFNNSAVEELEDKLIDNPFNWLSKVIEFAENYNTVVGIIKI